MLTAVRRPTFDDLNLSTGKRARLRRLMYEHGPANGTLKLLPIDQGLEHGPIGFFDNPDAVDTDWILKLARSLVLVFGGSKISDEDTLHKAKMAMEAGCVGLIFGRNMWQRNWGDAVGMSQRMHEVMKDYGQ